MAQLQENNNWGQNMDILNAALKKIPQPVTVNTYAEALALVTGKEFEATGDQYKEITVLHDEGDSGDENVFEYKGIEGQLILKGW